MLNINTEVDLLGEILDLLSEEIEVPGAEALWQAAQLVSRSSVPHLAASTAARYWVSPELAQQILEDEKSFRKLEEANNRMAQIAHPGPWWIF